MIKKIFVILLLLGSIKSSAQYYTNVLNYAYNGSPVNGVKIKTNLPFTPFTQMPTIHIMGYSYGTDQPIDLTLTYYIYSTDVDYSNPANFYVYKAKLSSSGDYTPKVFISNEQGKVVIYIDDKVYYQRFNVNAYAFGINEPASWFQNWTTADEPLTGTKTVEVPYANRFKGDVSMPANGIWNAAGNVGIGTIAPTEKLAVNGNIRAKEVKVETANWPDYVFAKGYALPSLKETEKHIQEKGHLPGIPSASEVKSNGVDLGEMNAKLLKKIEELTLYLIEMKKENESFKKDISDLKITITQNPKPVVAN